MTVKQYIEEETNMLGYHCLFFCFVFNPKLNNLLNQTYFYYTTYLEMSSTIVPLKGLCTLCLFLYWNVLNSQQSITVL